METSFHTVIIVFLTSLALAGNITGFYIKDILGKNGYVTYWYRGHFKDIFNFFDLIEKTTDENGKRNFKLIVKSHIAILLTFIALAIIFIFGDIKRSNGLCDYYVEFLDKELSGQLVEKFMDKPNHNFQTLTIKTDTQTLNDIDFALRNNGLYDSILIGDKIKKMKGDSITYIERNGKTTEFVVHRIEFCEN